jgi:hypothetical protein
VQYLQTLSVSLPFFEFRFMLPGSCTCSCSNISGTFIPSTIFQISGLLGFSKKLNSCAIGFYYCSYMHRFRFKSLQCIYLFTSQFIYSMLLFIYTQIGTLLLCVQKPKLSFLMLPCVSTSPDCWKLFVKRTSCPPVVLRIRLLTYFQPPMNESMEKRCPLIMSVISEEQLSLP